MPDITDILGQQHRRRRSSAQADLSALEEQDPDPNLGNSGSHEDDDASVHSGDRNLPENSNDIETVRRTLRIEKREVKKLEARIAELEKALAECEKHRREGRSPERVRTARKRSAPEPKPQPAPKLPRQAPSEPKRKRKTELELLKETGDPFIRGRHDIIQVKGPAR